MHPIQERILQINAEQSAQYLYDQSARERYWAKHPTFFAVIKCMDGRVHFHNMTQTPMGLAKAFRAIGGTFDIWWPSFLGRVRHWTEHATAKGSRTCVLVTYHYSASDPHLGCAGWGYDTQAARAHAEHLRDKLSFVFGEEMTAITAGVETDHDLLTLHGPNGDVSGSMLIGKSDREIQQALQHAFPQMDTTTREDITLFLAGNATRVDTLSRTPRSLEAKQHNERIIAVGQGFEWLAQSNLALIINDANPNLAESIRVAGSLIEKNLANAAPEDTALICTSIPYREPGLDYRQAVARAQGLLEFSQNVLQKSYPQLFTSQRIQTMATVMWEPSKKIEVL
jgi:hypothetical protein